MKLLDLTLDTPAANLALDEALLLQADRDPQAPDVLRLWESPTNFVVLGRSSKIADEVNQVWCGENCIPVLRRSSGGGTVVAGPGCLMYAVVLRYAQREHLRMLDQAHRFVMEKIRDAVISAGVSCSIAGICDLAINDRKISGNALHCVKNAFLYHGTLLYGMDLGVVENCLGTPTRQPKYRQLRGHSEFVQTIPLSRPELSESLVKVWNATKTMDSFRASLLQSVQSLMANKYNDRNWNESGRVRT